ncbi:DUF4282 domain-containing protein [Nocardiopsis gilva YIM 90087]|uniref:DUF4282 domain-containing protein n=2 Tax=Nocardiopsis gilva TaxID=280236 RepID=A0A223S977_9ACTN|nr:DUF4282 domain-containing protein [Nocardiopsis gilva]ASU84658.1 DUF4282 domain-containing protein [Nocardiopsis gilva YIM 90087]
MNAPGEYPYDPSQQYGYQQQPPPGGPGTPPPGGPYGPGTPPPPPGAPGQPMPTEKGFFGSLFDFSFREFVTSKIIKLLYILWLVLIGIFTLSGVITSFGFMAIEPVSGFLGLLGTILGGAIAVLITRVGLELLIVVFRISEDLSAIRKRGGF